MVKSEKFREIALSFPQTEELPHFEKTSFRINKKIFATLSPDKNRACIKLSESDQYAFCAFDETMIYPVNNKWGLQGWTNFDLSKMKKTTMIDALTTAFYTVSKPK